MKYFLFSVLHVAARLGYEQLIHDVLELIKQLPSTNPPITDVGDSDGRVSDEKRSV